MNGPERRTGWSPQSPPRSRVVLQTVDIGRPPKGERTLQDYAILEELTDIPEIILRDGPANDEWSCLDTEWAIVREVFPTAS